MTALGKESALPALQMGTCVEHVVILQTPHGNKRLNKWQIQPKIFQQNGYETAVIGKWHLGTTPTGFDYSKVLVNWGGQGTYFHPQFCINGKDTVTEKTRHSTKAIEDDCINWLSSRDTSKPFMLMYQFKAPHRDWRPDSIYHELFSDFDFPEPETFNDNYSHDRFSPSEKKERV